MSPRVPEVENLERYIFGLAQMVAKTSWLPNPEVVRKVNRAVFPVRRGKISQRTEEVFDSKHAAIGMYDDNTTPEWALFWTHGLEGLRPSGWTIAHVWTASDNIEAYTHPANLAMVTEALSSLTDKQGPLTGYLQYHASAVYGWKPSGGAAPEKPRRYDEIEWRYFASVSDPLGLVRRELQNRDNQRTRVLVPIMKRLGML